MEVQANPRVVLGPSMGAITLELDPAKAPVTSKNFLVYVASGHYEGTAERTEDQLGWQSSDRAR